MIAAMRQLVAGALQPRLGRDHVARREPLLVAPVLAQRHQLGLGAPPPSPGRTAPCRPNGGTRTREVAGREGRLLPGDAVQRDARIGDDPVAVLARDPP
jgi:hypothetical protein